MPRRSALRLQRQRPCRDLAHRLPGSARKEGASHRQLGRGGGCSGAECFAVGGGGAPRVQRQRVVGRAGRRFPGSARKEAASPRDRGRGRGALARSVWRWAGVALHGCNGSVRWGVLGAVSRARARKEAAPPRDKGRGAARVRRGALAGGAGLGEFTILGSLDLLWGHCLDVISDIPVTFRRTSDPKVGRVTPNQMTRANRGHFWDKVSLDHAAMPDSSRCSCTKSAPAYQK